MAYGQGEIHEKKNKAGKSYNPRRWEVVAQFGRDPLTGKRNRIKQTVRGTKGEANKELARMLEQLRGGCSAQGGRITFAEYAQKWHEKRAAGGEYQTRTIQTEELHIRYLCEVVGNMTLDKISGRTVEAALMAVKQGHVGKAGGPLSGTTMHHIAQTFSQIMKEAVNNDLIARNPCGKVGKPKLDTPEKKALTESELLQLVATLDKCEEEEYELLAGKEQRMQERGKRFNRWRVCGVSDLSYLIALRIAAATGLRTGEVLGLRWMDVDIAFELVGGKPAYSGVITVAQSLTNSLEIKKPKNSSSARKVTLDANTAAHLAQWKTAQGAALLTLGIRRASETPVCCSGAGSYISMGNYHRWRKKWIKENGLAYFTPHQLRHTHATRLLGLGVDAVTVANRLGHSTPATTLNVYAHLVPGNDAAAAELVGNMMHPNPPGTAEKTA